MLKAKYVFLMESYISLVSLYYTFLTRIKIIWNSFIRQILLLAIMSKCIYFSKLSNVNVKSLIYKLSLQQQNPQIAKFPCPSILNLIPVCTTSHTCGNHGGNRCCSLLYLPGIYSILYTRLSRNLYFICIHTYFHSYMRFTYNTQYCSKLHGW